MEEQAAEIAELKEEVASLKNSYGNLNEEFVYMQRDFEEQLRLREDLVKVSSDLESAIDENDQESKRCSVRITSPEPLATLKTQMSSLPPNALRFSMRVKLLCLKRTLK